MMIECDKFHPKKEEREFHNSPPSVSVDSFQSSAGILLNCDGRVLAGPINALHKHLIIRLYKEGQRLPRCSLLCFLLWNQHLVWLQRNNTNCPSSTNIPKDNIGS